MYRASVRLGAPWYPKGTTKSTERLIERTDDEKLSQNREVIGRLYNSQDENAKIEWKPEFENHTVLAFRDNDGKMGFAFTNKGVFHDIIAMNGEDVDLMNASIEYSQAYCAIVQRNRNFEIADKNIAEAIALFWSTLAGTHNHDICKYIRKFVGAVWLDRDETIPLALDGRFNLDLLRSLEWEIEHTGYIAQKWDEPRNVINLWNDLADINEHIDMEVSNVIMLQYVTGSMVLLQGMIRSIKIYFEEMMMHSKIISHQASDKLTTLDPYKGNKYEFGDGEGVDPLDSYDLFRRAREDPKLARVIWEETVEFSRDGVTFETALGGIDYATADGEEFKPPDYIQAYRRIGVKKIGLPDPYVKLIYSVNTMWDRVSLETILKQDNKSFKDWSPGNLVNNYIPSAKKMFTLHDDLNDGGFRLLKPEVDAIGVDAMRMITPFWIKNPLLEANGLDLEFRYYDITKNEEKEDMPLREIHLVEKISGENCTDAWDDYEKAFDLRFTEKMRKAQLREIMKQAQEMDVDIIKDQQQQPPPKEHAERKEIDPLDLLVSQLRGELEDLNIGDYMDEDQEDDQLNDVE